MSFSSALVTLSKVDIQVGITQDVSRVELTQTFTNANAEAVEAEYTFPVYADSAMVSCVFTSGTTRVACKIEEKGAAKRTYETALEELQQATLVSQDSNEQLTMLIANIRPHEPVVVKLQYVGRVVKEFGRRDDVYRFILPMTISQRRYGASSASAASALTYAPLGDERRLSISITLDQSQSMLQHDSLRAMCEVSSKEDRLTIKYDQNDIELDQDFVFLYSLHANHAVVETLEDGESSRALYANLDLRKLAIYKKAMQQVKPAAYIFLVDQSGSMGNHPMEHAKNALRIMLSGLHEGCMFNVVGFGSRFETMFAEPVFVTEERMATAKARVDRMTSNMGGTEMRSMLTHVFEQLPEQETFVYLLTDGEVWDKDAIATCIKSKKAVKPNLYLSCLGIGDSVSHDLLDAIAKHGGGVVQYTQTSESIEQKAGELFRQTSALTMFDVSLLIDGKPAEHDPTGIQLISVDPASVECVVKCGEDEEQITVPIRRTTDVMLHSIRAKHLIETLTNRDEIVALSKKYNVLSPHTAFVGVNEDDFVVIDDGDGAKRAPKVKIPMNTRAPPPVVSMGSIGGGGFGASASGGFAAPCATQRYSQLAPAYSPTFGCAPIPKQRCAAPRNRSKENPTTNSIKKRMTSLFGGGGGSASDGSRSCAPTHSNSFEFAMAPAESSAAPTRSFGSQFAMSPMKRSAAPTQRFGSQSAMAPLTSSSVSTSDSASPGMAALTAHIYASSDSSEDECGSSWDDFEEDDKKGRAVAPKSQELASWTSLTEEDVIKLLGGQAFSGFFTYDKLEHIAEVHALGQSESSSDRIVITTAMMVILMEQFHLDDIFQANYAKSHNYVKTHGEKWLQVIRDLSQGKVGTPPQPTP